MRTVGIVTLPQRPRRGRGGWAYLEDDFTRDNGPLGVIPGTSYAWDADSWAISSNKAVVTPTLGEELLTNGGFEGTYTDGLAANWMKLGSPTVGESSTAHGGSKAQSFAATATSNLVDQSVSIAAGTWFLNGAWCKATAGTGGNPRWRNFQSGGDYKTTSDIRATDYTWRQMIGVALGANTVNCGIIDLGGSGFDTILIDDASFKALTFASLVALVDLGVSGVNVQCSPTVPTVGQAGNEISHCGVIANCNAAKNSYILGLYWRGSGVGNAQLYKIVNGAPTRLISTATTYSAGAPLIVKRTAATTFQLWYNGVQIGTDQTISDAEIVGNTYHGMFSNYAGSTPGTFRVERA